MAVHHRAVAKWFVARNRPARLWRYVRKRPNCGQAGKLAMIGEVSYQYNGVRNDDPRLDPLWALAEELQVPIAVHGGSGPPGIVYRGQPLHRERIGDPSSFEQILVRHPLMLIIMHAGWPFLDNTVALLSAYPQVYVDLGAVDWAEARPGFDHYFEQLMIYGFGKRVLFGSDQMVWPEGIAQAIDRFRTAPYLTNAQRRDIFFRQRRSPFRMDRFGRM